MVNIGSDGKDDDDTDDGQLKIIIVMKIMMMIMLMIKEVRKMIITMTRIYDLNTYIS